MERLAADDSSMPSDIAVAARLNSSKCRRDRTSRSKKPFADDPAQPEKQRVGWLAEVFVQSGDDLEVSLRDRFVEFRASIAY
jgi:hypothetical protein